MSQKATDGYQIKRANKSDRKSKVTSKSTLGFLTLKQA